MHTSPPRITRLLEQWGAGDREGLDRVFAPIHDRARDPLRSRILEQRYFGGLSLQETADANGLSLATVKRHLRCARAWLATQLSEEDAVTAERSAPPDRPI